MNRAITLGHVVASTRYVGRLFPSRRIVSFVAVGLALGVLGTSGACGPKTSVTQVWKAQTTSPAPMRSVLVLAARMDEANRRAMEDTFVAQLAKHGVTGTPAYRLFPDRLPDEEQAREAARNAHVDGVMALTFKGVRQQLTYMPGSYAGDFWDGYYGPLVSAGAWSPGYVETDDFVNLEATLWDARLNDKVVWSALTQTTNPSSGRSFDDSVASKLVPELAKAQFIPQ
jgi:hypothetical protein